MVKFGIIGAGSIARKFAEDIKVVPNAKLVAVASRSIEKAQIFQQEFNLQYAFGSYSELAESDVIDAVYIATPHNFHKEQSIMFLNEGKHVLCEKPIAINNLEHKEMIKIATTNKKLLMEALWSVYLPANEYVLNVINSGKYGSIVKIDSSFGFKIENYETVEDKRLLNKDLAGGSLLDLGVYNIALSQYFKPGEIVDIQSQAEFFKTGVDLSTKTILTYSDGITVVAKTALNETLDNKLTIHFETGRIDIPDFWGATSIVENGEKLHFPTKLGGFEYEIESFCKTIESKKLQDPIMSHEKSSRVLDILDRIRMEIGLKYHNEQ